MSKDPNAVNPDPPGSEASFEELLKAAGLPEDYVEADAEATARKVAEAVTQYKAIRGGVPAQYDFGLPQDFEFPQGYTREQWQPDPEFSGHIEAIAREYGLPQDALTKLATAHAKNEIRKANAFAQARDKRDADEKAKLGPNGAERVNKLRQAIAADPAYGDDGMQALFGGGSARGIEILEDLHKRASAAGKSATQSGSGAQPKPDNSKFIGQPGGGRALFAAGMKRNRQ